MIILIIMDDPRNCKGIQPPAEEKEGWLLICAYFPAGDPFGIMEPLQKDLQPENLDLNGAETPVLVGEKMKHGTEEHGTVGIFVDIGTGAGFLCLENRKTASFSGRLSANQKERRKGKLKFSGQSRGKQKTGER